MLKPDGKLRRDQVIIVTRPAGFALIAVLHFELHVRRKTVAGGQLYAPEVGAPLQIATSAIVDVAEELLVPAKRAEPLRREFVFCLEIICKRVGIARARNFKTRLVKFRPQLQMAKRIADVLAEHELAIIISVAPDGQRRLSFAPEISAIAHRYAKVPRLSGPE